MGSISQKNSKNKWEEFVKKLPNPKYMLSPSMKARDASLSNILGFHFYT